MSDWTTLAVKSVVKDEIMKEVKKKQETNPKYTLGDWVRDVLELKKAVETKPGPILSMDLSLPELEAILNNSCNRSKIKELLSEREQEKTQKIKDDLEL